MEATYELARAVSILAFLGYGLSCFVSPHMMAEFDRYGLGRLRKLTGGLEIAGALGLLAGYAFPLMTIAAAAGLSLLMLMGIATRIRIGDPLSAMLPAILFLIVNLFVLVYAGSGRPSRVVRIVDTSQPSMQSSENDARIHDVPTQS